jgi:hypothetical protein
MKRTESVSSFSPTFAALQRKLGSGFTVGDLISRYLPYSELRIVAFVRDDAMVTRCKKKYALTKCIYFQHRRLQTIPPKMLIGFTHITHLYLQNNELQTIPDTMKILVNLISLDLGDNKLQQFPSIILSITWLSHLVLRNNQIQTIPDAIDNLTQLEYLVLSGNLIKIIPEDAINNLKRLRFFDFSGNPLTRVPVLNPKIKGYI